MRHGVSMQVKDRQPLLTPEDCILAEDIAKADPEVAAMVKEAYGITDLSLLACDPWSGGRSLFILLLACTEIFIVGRSCHTLDIRCEACRSVCCNQLMHDSQCT